MVIALFCDSALFCDNHVIVTCGSVTLAGLGVGTVDAWNTFRVRVKHGLLNTRPYMSHLRGQN